jgi:D-arabinose 1-dehydrogenase-like Zn-dependent alcohol dehydrogenase
VQPDTIKRRAMGKMRAVQVVQGGGALELVEREMPEPTQGEVRVRVEARGVCHSDSLTVEGQWPGLSFPRIPGHEIAGIIDAVSTGVAAGPPGSRSVWAGLEGIVIAERITGAAAAAGVL